MFEFDLYSQCLVLIIDLKVLAATLIGYKSVPVLCPCPLKICIIK